MSQSESKSIQTRSWADPFVFFEVIFNSEKDHAEFSYYTDVCRVPVQISNCMWHELKENQTGDNLHSSVQKKKKKIHNYSCKQQYLWD